METLSAKARRAIPRADGERDSLLDAFQMLPHSFIPTAAALVISSLDGISISLWSGPLPSSLSSALFKGLRDLLKRYSLAHNPSMAPHCPASACAIPSTWNASPLLPLVA